MVVVAVVVVPIPFSLAKLVGKDVMRVLFLYDFGRACGAAFAQPPLKYNETSMLPKKCSAAETSIRLGVLYRKEGIKRVNTEDKYRYYSLTSLLHDPLANPIPSVSFATSQATCLFPFFV